MSFKVLPNWNRVGHPFYVEHLRITRAQFAGLDIIIPPSLPDHREGNYAV
jgi:hypothetical protein